MNNDVSTPSLMDQLKHSLSLSSPNRALRALIFEYALVSAFIGLNPFPGLFSVSLVLVGIVTFLLMRAIGKRQGYPNGQDILAIAGNLFGGLGAFIMASLAWLTFILLGIYAPAIKPLALSAAYFTFTWIAGQATNQYYATGKAKETQVLESIPEEKQLQIAVGSTDLKRRRILMGLVATGSLITVLHEAFRLREIRFEQIMLSRAARESDTYVNEYLQKAFTSDTVSVEKIQAIKDSIRLTPPNIPYNRDISKKLIRFNRLGTEQYLTGTIVNGYEGEVQTLPSFEPALMSEYTQVGSIIGPEEATTTQKVEVGDTPDETPFIADPLRENLDQLQSIVEGVAGQVVVLKWLNPVYWGFVLTSPDHSVIVFRGTQQTSEWVQNAMARQTFPSPLSSFEFQGKVHKGFATIYSSIADQVVELAKQLDPSRPVYITGHSLGSSIATLAAMDIALRVPTLKDQIQLYSYAGPRVGDITFAETHSQLVPNSYRVVNVADAIPTAPPTLVGNLIYAHTGQLWTFVDYSGDVILGHFVSVYKSAVDQDKEQLAS